MAIEFLPKESQSDLGARAELEPGCPEDVPEKENGLSATAEALHGDGYLSMDFETRRKAINEFWSRREQGLVTAGQLEPRRDDKMSGKERE